MSQEPETKTFDSPDWARYFGLIRRRRLHFILPLFLGWVAIWVVSWLLPASYRSGTLILVEQPSVPSQYVVPNIAGNIQDRLKTMSQQILSRTRLLHIIETLNLYPKERQRMAPDDVVERTRKDVEIELVRSPDSDAVTSFNIYYSATNPKVAQQVTSELTKLFINENVEVRQQQSENTTKFLESQLEEARRALAEQEDKVRHYKDLHLGVLPGQLQSNLQILSGFQNELQAAQEALNHAKQQNVYLQSLLSQYRTLQRSTGGDSSPLELATVDQQLERLRSQLATLSSQYTERHPDIQKLKGQIARTEAIRQQILQSPKPSQTQPADDSIEASAGPDRSPRAELQGQLKVNEIEIKDRERAIQTLQAKILDYQGRLNQAPVREQELAELTRGYDQSKANYDSLLAKKNNSELATNLEFEQKSEHFQILDPPTLPLNPYSPNRLKLCGIGLAVGIALGLLCAAAFELLDDRLFGEQAIKNLLPVVILSEIPDIATADELHSSHWRNRLQWAAVAMVAMVILAGSALTFFRG
jgi:polysaccharide biosynthesis transport protein